MTSKRFRNRCAYGTSPYSYLGFPIQAKNTGPEQSNHATVQPMTTEGAETAPSKKENNMEEETNIAGDGGTTFKKSRKPMTPEQRAKKNEGDRLRRARQKAAKESSAQPTF